MNSKISFIVSALMTKYGLDEASAEKFAALMFDVIAKGLKADRQVKVKGLGTFRLVEVGSRESVDVNTGERIVIEARDKVVFVPDTVLRDRVNSPFAQFETVALNDGVDFSELDKKLDGEDAEVDDSVEFDVEGVDSDADIDDSDVDSDDSADADSADSRVEHADADADIVADEDSISNPEPAKPTSEPKVSEDEEPGKATQKAADDSDRQLDTVSSRLSDASAKLSSASSKLSDVSDRLNNASEKLTGASACLSDSSQKMADVAADGAEALSDSKKLSDALAINNDLRKRLFTMKEENFSFTNENRKLKNKVQEQSDSIKSLRRWIYGLSGVLVVLIAVAVAGGIYGTSLLEEYELQAQTKKENVAKPSQPKAAATATSSDGAQKKADVKPAEDVASTPDASAQSVVAAEKKHDEAAQTTAVVTNKPTKTADKPATDADKTAKNTDKTGKNADKPTKNADKAVDKVDKSSVYDADPRVRTGAYRIVGIANTVTLRKGETLASISRAYLGPGMECYVEAVNGDDVAEGGKVKIPKLELKKKKSKR